MSRPPSKPMAYSKKVSDRSIDIENAGRYLPVLNQNAPTCSCKSNKLSLIRLCAKQSNQILELYRILSM